MKQCLLLVDFQKEMKIPDVNNMIIKIENAIDAAKENNVHCVNILFIGKPGSQLLKDWPEGIADGVTHANEDSLLCECDEVMVKSGYCMEDKDARDLVSRFDRIFLVGGYLEACELAVGLQLSSLAEDCEIYCISDLSYGRADGPYEVSKCGMALLDWNLFGRIISYHDALKLFED